MKTLKHILRVGALVVALALFLAACGNGNDGGPGGTGTTQPPATGTTQPPAAATLSGTFVYEDGAPGTWTFTGNSFVASIPYSEMYLGELEGDFSIRGTFSISESAQTISLTVDEDALREDTLQLTRDLLAQDPDLVGLMEDPEFEEFFESLIDGMFDSIFDFFLQDFDDIELRFENGFDRLIDEDGSVLVRQ